jgi:hypothetical protein
MIRRGIWLAAGAVLGITGYRRASRLARSLVPARSSAGRAGTSTARLTARPPALTSRQVLAGAARAGRYAAGTAAFVRDVRDGMAEYLDRHDRDAHRSLEGQQGPAAGRRPAP